MSLSDGRGPTSHRSPIAGYGVESKGSASVLWIGEAYRAAEEFEKADDAFKAVIAIDEYSDVAEQAREALSSLLGSAIRRGVERQADRMR